MGEFGGHNPDPTSIVKKCSDIDCTASEATIITNIKVISQDNPRICVTSYNTDFSTVLKLRNLYFSKRNP